MQFLSKAGIERVQKMTAQMVSPHSNGLALLFPGIGTAISIMYPLSLYHQP
jgi:hypothetical protein